MTCQSYCIGMIISFFIWTNIDLNFKKFHNMYYVGLKSIGTLLSWQNNHRQAMWWEWRDQHQQKEETCQWQVHTHTLATINNIYFQIHKLHCCTVRYIDPATLKPFPQRNPFLVELHPTNAEPKNKFRACILKNLTLFSNSKAENNFSMLTAYSTHS